jgi:uncharacterized repeat protein (TIGR01451 family)
MTVWNLPLQAQTFQSFYAQATTGIDPKGIPTGGPYIPAGILYDNEQSSGSTSLASQDSSGTFTTRSADDFLIAGTGCTSGIFDISQIRIQMVQNAAAPQPFAIDIYSDNGSGTAPVSGISPIFTFSETMQTALGPFGVNTIFEAGFNTPGLQLNADTIYWISGYGADAAANPAGFNNFFAASNGAAGTTANGVIIAPGAGVPDWTPADQVIGPPGLAFSFAIDGSCTILDADLALSKNGVVNGAQIIYTLTVSNNGPLAASNVVVTDTLPAEVSYVSDDCGAANLPPFTWNVGTLANGATASCNVTVTANSAGVIANTASVSADQNDPLPANNSATATLTASLDADLALSKNGVVNGAQIVYTLTVSNNGPLAASNVVVTDTLPAEISYVSDDCGAANLPPFTWNVGTLANGATASCNVTVSASSAAAITNSASVSADQNDPVPANNSATVTLTAGATGIPTVSWFGLMVLATMLMASGPFLLRSARI